VAKETNRQPLPPYLSFKTFLSFIERLQQTIVPETIDNSLLRNYSGSVARSIISALRFLKLIDDNGKTNERLIELVDAYGETRWQGEFGKLLMETYEPIVNGLNLELATRGALENKFRDWGADGRVLDMCIRFYIAAMQSAGIPCSPHILQAEARRSNRGRTRPKTKRLERTPTTEEIDGPQQAGTVRFSFPIPAKQSANIYVPADITEEDWNMIDAMMAAYIQRKEKGEKEK